MSDGWLSTSNTRCQLQDSQSSLNTLEECKANCGQGCPFILYNTDTESRQNCWIADSSQNVSSACSIDKATWTVYEPVAVDMSHKWTLIPNQKCELGDGEPGKLTLDQCASACKKDCPFFLYHPRSPYNENCWTASRKNNDTVASRCYGGFYGFFVYLYPEQVSGWSVSVNVKCTIGSGEEGFKTAAQCAQACGTDCPFFLYHANSPHAENCWTANRFHSVFNDCSFGRGYVLYTRAAPTTSSTPSSTTPAIIAPTAAAVSKSVTTKERPSVTKTYVCVVSIKHRNGVCDEELNTKMVV